MASTTTEAKMDRYHNAPGLRVVLLALGFGLLVSGCGSADAGRRIKGPIDAGVTPAYEGFLSDLRFARLSVQAIGMKQVNGHWSSSDTVAADGCQCAQTWATLYIEHRLSVNGHEVVVDEELIPGAIAGLEPPVGSSTDAATRRNLHQYRLANLLVSTVTGDSRLLTVLDKLNGAKATE